ncbi:putative TIR domain, P-loop containing nucleoside triphosphate hydrolase [Helianthus annuus]|nr:putative TIR domain, P-loop containing nucleoside triphosphate hydrolase [Helianthus annuus]
MASTSSTSAPTSHYDYDVFLSFRGEDTRHSFTDHLYKALHQAGIRTFRDDDEIHEGQQLKPEIERSITTSRASIIVISNNFANSRWCLDELSFILQQKRNARHLVFPVFYGGVDPSDVRNQRGSFTIEAKEGSKWTEDNVIRWKEALTEVADLKGMVVSGSETAFIADIVQKVYCELDLKLLSTPTGLTGIDTRAEGINSWLRSVQPDHSVLAICGMGGSGKTTLAKYIYNLNKQNFECSSFLEGIENQPAVLLGLQKQLLRDVSGNNIMISNLSEGAFQIEKVIERKKVLIVIDDIDDKDTLNTLVGTKVFHTQSKIIITTRHLTIHTWFGSISIGCHVNKIELLNDHESLELLSYHAFGSKVPMEGFEELAIQLAKYCEGNPLALKVLGSSLSEGQGTRIETWRSTMNSLNSLKGDINIKIQGVLQKSFDTLSCESHRELFLHIACFFLGEHSYYVKRILEDDYHAGSGIVTLINRCLVTDPRVSGKKLAMHKLLQEMARNIVRKDSKDPAEHSRVWRDDECKTLLRNGDGSKKIEGLVLKMEDDTQGMGSNAFKTSSLIKMKNLKFLHLDNVKLTGTYKNFPDLRWLKWHKCYLKTIPAGLLTNCLVALHMSYGDLEEFNPPMVLNSLKFLDLSLSCKLVSLCNLHRLPKLVALDLLGCISLSHVCKTIGYLKNLSNLRLVGCTRLWKALSNQKCVNQLERTPEQPLFALPQSLSMLSLSHSSIEILPHYVDLKMLLALELTSCPNLKSLPCLPSTLKTLRVDWCTSLERITFQSARFTLQVFCYEGCFKLCEIEGLFKLVSVEKVDEADLGHMQWIKAYKDHKVDLVGDEITKGRSWNIQMLYEYGIRSTYLQGIKDQSMATHEYTSSSKFLSFRVPLHPKKHKIHGLNVTVLYRSLVKDINTELPLFFAKISNRTRGVSWVYSPVVYCKPRVDDDVVWLSYWPIGNLLDAGDDVYVDIIEKEGTIIISGYGASLVYKDGGEVEEKSEEEVIGGDLSRFEVTKGGYYLCCRDFFNSIIPAIFFGSDIHIPDSRRWRTCSELTAMHAFEEFNNFRNPNRYKWKVTLAVNFSSESEIKKIEKAVSSVPGVESVSNAKEIGRLIVIGHFDHQAVVTCVRGFEKMVQVLQRIPL